MEITKSQKKNRIDLKNIISKLPNEIILLIFSYVELGLKFVFELPTQREWVYRHSREDERLFKRIKITLEYTYLTYNYFLKRVFVTLIAKRITFYSNSLEKKMTNSILKKIIHGKLNSYYFDQYPRLFNNFLLSFFFNMNLNVSSLRRCTGLIFELIDMLSSAINNDNRDEKIKTRFYFPHLKTNDNKKEIICALWDKIIQNFKSPVVCFHYVNFRFGPGVKKIPFPKDFSVDSFNFTNTTTIPKTPKNEDVKKIQDEINKAEKVVSLLSKDVSDDNRERIACKTLYKISKNESLKHETLKDIKTLNQKLAYTQFRLYLAFKRLVNHRVDLVSLILKDLNSLLSTQKYFYINYDDNTSQKFKIILQYSTMNLNVKIPQWCKLAIEFVALPGPKGDSDGTIITYIGNFKCTTNFLVKLESLKNSLDVLQVLKSGIFRFILIEDIFGYTFKSIPFYLYSETTEYVYEDPRDAKVYNGKWFDYLEK